MTEWLPSGVEPQRGRYRFTAKEKEDGTPWIAAEPAGDTIKIVGSKGNDLELGFSLRPGTTIADAHALAAAMNKWIGEITLYEVRSD